MTGSGAGAAAGVGLRRGWYRKTPEPTSCPHCGSAWFARHLLPNHYVEAEEMWDWLENGIAWTCVYQCQACGVHRVYVDAD